MGGILAYFDNYQYSNPNNYKTFDYWLIGIYLELGIWLLEFSGTVKPSTP